MVLSSGWAFTQYHSFSDFRWGMAALPFAGPERRDLVYTNPWVISSQSAHPEEAWIFLQYLASPEVQAQWSQQMGWAPARQSLLQGWCQQFPGMTPEENVILTLSVYDSNVWVISARDMSQREREAYAKANS